MVKSQLGGEVGVVLCCEMTCFSLVGGERTIEGGPCSLPPD